MNKTSNRKEEILEQALKLTSLYGLEALTIGKLAEGLGMSKSGLFRYFKSKENLQVAVLDYAVEQYNQLVIGPSLAEPRGIPRIRALVTHWLVWHSDILPGGCPFIGGVFEYDDRTGPVKNHLKGLLETYQDFLAKMAQIAVDEGHFGPQTDVQQFAYELFSMVFGGYHYIKLLETAEPKPKILASLEGLLERYQAKR